MPTNFGRDPEFIRRYLRVLGPFVETWYAPEYEGFEHVPAGRALLVGTHNGGFIGPDLFSLMAGVWRALGTERPMYGLAHDIAFRVPGMAAWLRKIGGVPAKPHVAEQILEADEAVIVFPGGTRDAYKRHANQHVVDFYGRVGFLRAAIRTGAPIVPVVSAGAHDAIFVVNAGVRAAHALGLDTRFRLDTLPIALCAPWGLAIGPVPYVPMPCKVRIAVLPPIALELPASAADDRAELERAYQRVVGVMQAGVDALVAKGDFGLRARLRAVVQVAARARGRR